MEIRFSAGQRRVSIAWCGGKYSEDLFNSFTGYVAESPTLLLSFLLSLTLRKPDLITHIAVARPRGRYPALLDDPAGRGADAEVV